MVKLKKIINTTTQLEQNKALARQLTKAQNENDASLLKKILSPNFKCHISDVPLPLTREQYIEGVKKSHESFSNLKFIIADLIAEGDKVVVRVIARGKHTGKYQGFVISKQKVEYQGIAIRRISKGKVVEEWQTNDQLSLLQQIGLVVNHII
jgi:predicted ester cyclase